MDAKLGDLVTRLEKCVQSLESRGGSGSEDLSESIEFFDKLVPEVEKFASSSEQISAELGSATKVFKDLFCMQRDVLVSSCKSKEPKKEALVAFLKPLTDKLCELQKLLPKDRTVDNHFKALAEAGTFIQWLTLTAKASSAVQAGFESSQFYSNRVLKDLKDKPGHKEWVAELNSIQKNLTTFVQDNFPKGLVWNPKGEELKSSQTSAPASAKPVAASTGGDKSSLFASLNAGSAVTSGLKKVDDSQKTHKNPNLRAGAVVPEKKATGSTTPKPASKAASNLPPVFEFSNKKWTIENQSQQCLDIDKGEISHILYMYNCTNTQVRIHQKINSITMDKCKKCAIILEKGLISSFEIINSQGSSVQANELVPTIALGSCDDANIFLAESSYATEITSSKISGVNVSLMKSDNSDPVEHPMPEQYITRVVDNKLVTEEVKHA